MTHNHTHTRDLARALSRATSLTYQQAHQHVLTARAAGRLPARLDDAGMGEALELLRVWEAGASPSAAIEQRDGSTSRPDPIGLDQLVFVDKAGDGAGTIDLRRGGVLCAASGAERHLIDAGVAHGWPVTVLDLSDSPEQRAQCRIIAADRGRALRELSVAAPGDSTVSVALVRGQEASVDTDVVVAILEEDDGYRQAHNRRLLGSALETVVEARRAHHGAFIGRESAVEDLMWLLRYRAGQAGEAGEGWQVALVASRSDDLGAHTGDMLRAVVEITTRLEALCADRVALSPSPQRPSFDPDWAGVTYIGASLEEDAVERATARATMFQAANGRWRSQRLLVVTHVEGEDPLVLRRALMRASASGTAVWLSSSAPGRWSPDAWAERLLWPGQRLIIGPLVGTEDAAALSPALSATVGPDTSARVAELAEGQVLVLEPGERNRDATRP